MAEDRRGSDGWEEKLQAVTWIFSFSTLRSYMQTINRRHAVVVLTLNSHSGQTDSSTGAVSTAPSSYLHLLRERNSDRLWNLCKKKEKMLNRPRRGQIYPQRLLKPGWTLPGLDTTGSLRHVQRKPSWLMILTSSKVFNFISYWKANIMDSRSLKANQCAYILEVHWPVINIGDLDCGRWTSKKIINQGGKNQRCLCQTVFWSVAHMPIWV